MVERIRKIVLALIIGLLLARITMFRFSSWSETVTTAVFIISISFLEGVSIGALIRGPGAIAADIAFAVSFLVWPSLNGLLSQFAALALYGMLETLPAMVGALVGMALRMAKIRAPLSAGAAIVATCLISVGPPHK